VLCAQFRDQGEDCCVRKSGRAGHDTQCSQLRKITETCFVFSLTGTKQGPKGPSHLS
jgi:hypothetical protein